MLGHYEFIFRLTGTLSLNCELEAKLQKYNEVLFSLQNFLKRNVSIVIILNPYEGIYIYIIVYAFTLLCAQRTDEILCVILGNISHLVQGRYSHCLRLIIRLICQAIHKHHLGYVSTELVARWYQFGNTILQVKVLVTQVDDWQLSHLVLWPPCAL